MKSKIKALKNRMVRLDYKVNGYRHKIHGTVRKVFIVCFDFEINGEEVVKIRFENCDKITKL